MSDRFEETKQRVCAVFGIPEEYLICTENIYTPYHWYTFKLHTQDNKEFSVFLSLDSRTLKLQGWSIYYLDLSDPRSTLPPEKRSASGRFQISKDAVEMLKPYVKRLVKLLGKEKVLQRSESNNTPSSKPQAKARKRSGKS